MMISTSQQQATSRVLHIRLDLSFIKACHQLLPAGHLAGSNSAQKDYFPFLAIMAHFGHGSVTTQMLHSHTYQSQAWSQHEGSL